MDSYDVIVAGAGAAGLLAAAEAAARGRRTLLLEKNNQPGVKILMSGGTRCNLTQSTNVEGIVSAYGKQGKFLRSALAALSPDDLVAMVEAEGVAVKIESTGKIFPVSDDAADVLAAFVARFDRSGAELSLQEPVAGVTPGENGFTIRTPRRELTATSFILTTGGKSYPGSGTTGDGYAWAAALGHTIVPPLPALTPVSTSEPWVAPLKGVTMSDVLVEVIDPRDGPKAKPLASYRDALLFAHFGLTGPAALNVSRAISRHPFPKDLLLRCNWLPDERREDVLAWLVDACGHEGKRTVSSIVATRLARRLAETLCELAGLPDERRAAELSKAERDRLVDLIVSQRISVTGTLGFGKAEVTAGGVSLNEVDSRDMQSKVAKGLYLAGEILDLDGPIGGYNFQAAFSTGYLAGQKA